MPVRIRLKRMGRKKAPHYRIVVADSASPRDGRFVETLGYYKPTYDPARIVVDLERVDHWIGKGALPSDTVSSLLRKARRGGDESVRVGEPDPEEVKSERLAALAARQSAEKAARAEAADAEAAQVAAAAAAAELEAAEAAAAEAVEAEAAAEPEDDGDDIPTIEVAVEAEEAPSAEADSADEAAGDEEE
jgi:small subunit ribosomal protein S16